MNVEWRQAAADSQSKPHDLVCGIVVCSRMLHAQKSRRLKYLQQKWDGCWLRKLAEDRGRNWRYQTGIEPNRNSRRSVENSHRIKADRQQTGSDTTGSGACQSYFFLACVSWTIIGQPCRKQRLHLQSVARTSSHSASSEDTGQDSTMWDIVWVSPQGHRSVSVSRHFLLQAPQCPCSVQKRFSKFS